MNLPQLSAIPTDNLKSQSPNLLIKTFKFKVIDTNEFLSIRDVKHIHCFITCYQRHVKSCVTVMSRICYCCGLFIILLLFIIVLKSDPKVVTTLDKDKINMTFFDYYSREINEYWFCYSYFYILKKKKVLKFYSINKVNIVIC